MVWCNCHVAELKQVSWKVYAFYNRYLHNDITRLLIPKTQNKVLNVLNKVYSVFFTLSVCECFTFFFINGIFKTQNLKSSLGGHLFSTCVNISYLLIHKHMCMCQGVRKFCFSKAIAYVLNEWPLEACFFIKSCIQIFMTRICFLKLLLISENKNTGYLTPKQLLCKCYKLDYIEFKTEQAENTKSAGRYKTSFPKRIGRKYRHV